MSGKSFSGNTKDAAAPILGARFWNAGKSISGIVLLQFPTKNGPCWTISLDKPQTIDGDLVSPPAPSPQEYKAVSIGALKGFEMAKRAAMGGEEFQPGDLVKISCTGFEEPTEEEKNQGMSPMVMFDLVVFRPDKPVDTKRW